MSKDPAFLFYPGDYLRDTQCLSESVQVAYDRIMCEHMRNICISQSQLNFFTKRLNEDQRSELMMVLKKVEGGFCIEWVYESVLKRRVYSESRRENRLNHKNKISKSYDKHMENENINENEVQNTSIPNKAIVFNFDDIWSKYPKRIGKNHALRHFKATVKNEKDFDDIHIALNNYISSERVFNGYTQNGSTWFNQWRDWVDHKENVCEKCHGRGKYISTTGYEMICTCPRGKK